MALLGLLVIGIGSGWIWAEAGEATEQVVRWVAWEWILGLSAYILFSLGLFPAGEHWRLRLGPTAAGIVSILAAIIPPIVWGIRSLYTLPKKQG